MIIESILSALIGLATEGVFSKSKDRVLLLLKEKGFEIPPPNTFEGCYLHALIEFGAEKPPIVIELFKHEFIQNTFYKAYQHNNFIGLSAEIENLLDWHEVGKDFKQLDIDPKNLVDEFSKTFHSVVDRTRTPYQVRSEIRSESILENQIFHIEQTQYGNTLLEQIYASVAANNIGETNIPEVVYKHRIEQARKFIKSGQSVTAKEMLQDLENELKGKEVSPKLYYELYTNIASAHLHLEEHNEACKNLDIAFSYNRDDPKSIANAALSALIQGDNKRAIELSKDALALDENQPYAISVLLQASKKDYVEVPEDIKVRAEQHVESRRILAIFSFEAGDFETAEKLYRENLNSSDSEVQDKVLLAQVILASEEKKIPPGTHFLVLPEKVKERLYESEQLLLSTKNEWDKDNNRNRFVNTLGLLIQVQSLQRKNDLVWGSAQQLLAEFPDHYPALFHCGLIELFRNNYKSAIIYLEKALAKMDPGDIRDRRIPLATAYLQDKKYSKVVDLLQEEIPSISRRENVERLVLLSKAYVAINKKDEVKSISNLLESDKEDDPYILEGLSQIQIELGEDQAAYQNLEKAFKNALDFEKPYFAVMLAEFHYKLGEFEKAVPFYELSFSPNEKFPLLDHYLISLLNSGFYDKANSLAKLYKQDDPTNSLFLIIEARIAEYIGELDNARALYVQLMNMDHGNPEYLMRVALIDYRNGKNEDSFNLLDKNIDKFWNDPIALITIAQIGVSAKNNEIKILDYAYRARRLGINNPQIHEAYVALFFNIEETHKKYLDLKKVDVNASVSVRTNSGVVKWYTILNEEPIDKGKGEISPTDPLAQKLIGSQKNDVIQIRDNFYEKLEFTILEIKSKYVAALHETLESFSTLFPENYGIQMMKVEDNDPTKAVAMSARQNQVIRQINEFYAKENITIGQLSKLIGISQIQVWVGLGFNAGIAKASIGTHQEQEDYAITVKDVKDITLELTGLLSIANLNLLSLLPKRFDNIYITQTTLDVLIEEINSKQNFMKDYLSIEHNQDQIAIREIKKEQGLQYVSVLKDIVGFIHENCKITPVNLAIKLEKEKYTNMTNVLTTSCVDSILIAKETKTLLFSDDMVLRAFARIEFGVNGVWTHPILQDCLIKNILSEDTYHKAIGMLIFANYSFVPVNTETLIFFLEKNNWVISGEIARLFQILAGPRTSIQSALQIATLCTKEIWSKSLLYHQKIDILTLILSSLVKNRLSVPTIKLFEEAIISLFRSSFTPWYADEIISHTKAWLQTHLSLSNKGILH